MKILKQSSPEDILFIDIETSKEQKILKEGTPLYDSWKYKILHNKDTQHFTEEQIIEEFDEKAALFAEFGKIIVITIGKIKDGVLKLKSYNNIDEVELLQFFCKDINNIVAANKKTTLCGFAIKGFDIPYLMRRCLINQVELPSLIDIGHLKPWEIPVIDLMELWKASGFSPISLINVCVALKILSPKDDIEGKDTSRVYWEEKGGLERITKYCEKDVLSCANIYSRCRYESLIKAQVSDIKEKEVGLLQKAYNTGNLSGEETSKLMKNYSKLSADEKPLADEILTIARKTK